MICVFREDQANQYSLINWTQCELDFYDKVVEWIMIISKELEYRDLQPRNVYNDDEMGVQLNVLRPLISLIRHHGLCSHVKYILKIKAACGKPVTY